MRPFLTQINELKHVLIRRYSREANLIDISVEGLAAMLADAHRDGWEKGHDLIPLNPEQTFLEYQEAVEGMCAEVKH